MDPTTDWLHAAEKQIRLTLEGLRPKLLETQGSVGHRLKDNATVVTEMDLLVENNLRDVLHRLDPGVNFSGEETGVDYDQPTFWLVDPIDGTEPFMRGLPFATNMVALIDQGQPIMSVIYNFTLGDYYLAVKGRGATRNGHAIRVSERPLTRAFVIKSDKAARVPSFRTSKFNASGYEYGLVASGAMEGLVTYSTVGNPWDHAAGVLLTLEAGGRAANLGSKGYDFRDANLVASNAIIFDELKKHADLLIAS